MYNAFGHLSNENSDSFLNKLWLKKRTRFCSFWFVTLKNYSFKTKPKIINLLNNIKERNERNKSVLNSIKLSRYS